MSARNTVWGVRLIIGRDHRSVARPMTKKIGQMGLSQPLKCLQMSKNAGHAVRFASFWARGREEAALVDPSPTSTSTHFSHDPHTTKPPHRMAGWLCVQPIFIEKTAVAEGLPGRLLGAS